MKKLLFTLVTVLFSVSTYSQLQRTVTFDLSNPSSLTYSPSFRLGTTNGEQVPITDIKFTSTNIDMSFSRVNESSAAYYLTRITNGVSKYYIQLDAGTQWIFTAKNGVRITSISFPENDWIGGLVVASGYPGTYDETKGIYTCTEGTSQVALQNNVPPTNTLFSSVTITYSENPLKETAYPTPLNGFSGSSFKEVKLTYDRNITSYSGGITSSANTAFNVSYSGSVATLSFSNAITAEGNYTIYIPAGCFTFTDGYQNVSMNYSFTVATPKNTFLPSSIEPEEGELDSLVLPIKLTFSGNTQVRSNMATGGSMIQDSNTNHGELKFAKDGNNGVSVSSDWVTEPLKSSSTTESSYVVITIPENTIYTVDGTYNPKITLEYTLKPKAENPTPTPGPDPTPGYIADTDTMKAAISLVANTGLGYPTESAASRTELAKVIADFSGKMTAENKDSIDSVLVVRIGNFYKEANVVFPENGKYYKVNAETPAGSKLYLQYVPNDNAVVITDVADNASAFEVETHDGALAFKTKEGKYLHLLSNSDNFESTSTSNITETYSALNNLTLAKLVAGNDSTKTFGLFSVYGSLGKDLDNGTEATGYARVRFSGNKAPGVSSPSSVVEFAENNSCAFRFVESQKQKPVKPDTTIVNTDFILSTATVVNGDSVVLSMPTISNPVTLNNTLQVTITNDNDSVISDNVVISAISGSANTFKIGLTGIASGTYHINLPEGLFSYTDDQGNLYLTKAASLDFTIENSNAPSDPSNFMYLNESYPEKGLSAINFRQNANQEMNDVDLNNFMVYYDKRELSNIYVDETATVNVYVQLTYNVVATGHLEKTSFDQNRNNYVGAKLVLDNEVKSGDLQSGDYVIVIPEASYGDENFGKWLQNSASIAKSECRVNPTMNLHHVISNTSGINSITIDNDANPIVYDIQGRRVEKITHPGIYIINGKKVVRK